MLLSEMFGVERETDFGVEGYARTFKIILHCNGAERLMSKYPGESFWQLAKSEIICTVIRDAPANIIHLPPPMTDEQREQLKALYRLGYRYITRSISLTIEAHVGKPRQVMNEWKQGGLRAYVPYVNGGLYGLPIKNETEPYDIAKALGVEG